MPRVTNALDYMTPKWLSDNKMAIKDRPPGSTDCEERERREKNPTESARIAQRRKRRKREREVRKDHRECLEIEYRERLET